MQFNGDCGSCTYIRVDMMANRMLTVKKIIHCKWCGQKLGMFIVRGKYCCFSCMEHHTEWLKKKWVFK
jgi:hypothetical protein